MGAGVLRALLLVRRAALVVAALISGLLGLVMLLGVVTPEGVGTVSTLQLGLVAALLTLPVVTAVAWRADRAATRAQPSGPSEPLPGVDTGRGRGTRPAHRRRRRGSTGRRRELREAS